jgi:hypothetical protein
MSKGKVVWTNRPAPKDFRAAGQYLSLVYPAAVARRLERRLRNGTRVERAAKDLLRASRLPLLDENDSHVAADLKRIHKAKRLAPVLLIQGDMTQGIFLTIADGYHRICAAYHYDQNAPIACQVIPLPG